MFNELVTKNRSVRGFDAEVPIKREDMMEIINCARFTASGINKQPLKFVLINEKAKNSIIKENINFGGLLPELNLPYGGEEPPAYIIICHDLNIAPDTESILIDVGIAAQTISLKAVEMGLNTCMIGSFKKGIIEKKLDLPDNIICKLVIAIGKSKEKIEIIEIEDGDSTAYYRKDNIHYVPKRKLEDIVIE